MKTVNFKKWSLENFSCFQEKMEFEVNNEKLTMISGKNGVGKTTIFDAISFTLYGITSKGLRGNDVVNTKIGKNCHTSVSFSIDEIDYLADRYYAHSRMRNTAILKRDGVPYKKGPTEVNHEIERLLMPYKLFNNSVMFGQKVKTFFTDLDDTKQKDIFRKILRLDDYVLYHKKSGEFIKEIDGLLTTNVNGRLINKNLIDSYKRETSLLIIEEQYFGELKTQKITEYKEQTKIINSKLQTLNSDIVVYAECENSLKSLNENHNKYQSQLKELEIQFKNIVEQIQSKAKNKQLEMSNKASQMISEETNKFNIKLNKIDSEINRLDSEFRVQWMKWDKERAIALSEIESLKTQIEIVETEKEKFMDSVINADISTCPTCNQDIDEKTIDDLKKYINSLDEKINQNKNDIENRKLIIDKVIEKIDKYKPVYEKTKYELDQKKLDYNTERRENNKNIQDRLNAALEKLKEMVMSRVQEQTENIRKDKDEINSVVNDLMKERTVAEDGYMKYNQLKNSITDNEFQIRKYNDLIKSKSEEKFDKSRTQMYIDKIGNHELENQKLEKEALKIKKRFEILTFWKEAYSKSGIESMLIDESIPFMNERVNEYLEKLSFGRYSLTFDTVKQMGGKDEFRDKIHLNVLDNVTLSDSREKFSGGQTRILDISVILTLCDLQSSIQDVKFNLLLFDEIFDSLDDENILKVSKLLRTLTKDRSIYLISHRHIDQIDVDEELKFM